MSATAKKSDAKKSATKTAAAKTAPKAAAPKAKPVAKPTKQATLPEVSPANDIIETTAESVVETTATVVQTPTVVQLVQPVDAPPAPRFRVSATRQRRGTECLDAHREWANRPADEAVYTFEDLLARTEKARSTSRELPAQAWSDLRVEPRGMDLALVSPSGEAILNNWSAKQLCSIVEAPADYIARMPGPIVADCLNYGLQRHNKRKLPAAMLVQDRASGARLRSLTTDMYERVWDHEIATLANELHTKGTWGACEAFKSASSDRVSHAWSDSKRLPLGWVGERSSFIALADYEGAVTVNGSKLARFALLSNSEVGAAGLKIVFGLMDFACANFILWGCQQVTEVKVLHVGNIRDRFKALTAPMTHRLESGEKETITSKLTAAGKTLIADKQEQVFARVSQVTRLPKALIEDAWNRAEATPRYGDPRSVWGMLSGLTEASQHAYDTADKRTASDESAAKLLDLVR